MESRLATKRANTTGNHTHEALTGWANPHSLQLAEIIGIVIARRSRGILVAVTLADRVNVNLPLILATE